MNDCVATRARIDQADVVNNVSPGRSAVDFGGKWRLELSDRSHGNMSSIKMSVSHHETIHVPSQKAAFGMAEIVLLSHREVARPSLKLRPEAHCSFGLDGSRPNCCIIES